MKLKAIILTLCSFIIIDVIVAQNPCKEVVGYYPNWQWYDRGKLVNPATIDYSRYTILNYAFFKPEADGSISGTDPWADDNLLLGEMDWQTNQPDFTTSIIYHAQQNGVKILPSIGGWTLSNNFPSIAADPVKRAQFAQSCVNLISTYQFDGIDLDWEYPGFAQHGGTPQDKVNFTLLLNEIRTAIDAYGQSINKPMMLTIAVGAGSDKMDDVEWNNVAQVVDIINLMSYDFFGTWDATTNHNAPLYAPAQGDPEFNVHSTVQRLINQYNVAPNKITVGVAFYGRSAITSGAPGLHAASTGQADLNTFQVDQGTPLYYNVLASMGQFTAHFDAQARVPYLTGNNGLNSFVSYDNPQSIAEKAAYVVDHNLRGAIIWEITGDYLETAPGSGIIAGTPLADTLNHVFCNYTGTPGSAPVVTVSAGSTEICEGESVTLTATGATNYQWNTGGSDSTLIVSPTSTTTYTVVGSNQYGSDTASFDITVYAVPATPTITQNGGQLTSTLANQYQWFFNGAAITGATAQSYNPTADGDYSVQVWDDHGCSAVSAPFQWLSSGLHDGEAPVLKVYPNPTQGVIYLEFGAGAQAATLTVRNTLGQEVFSEQLRAEGRHTVLLEVEPGLYFLDVFSEAHGHTSHLVVKR